MAVPDPERLSALLTRLEPLLIANDTAANDVFAASESLLAAALGDEARRIGRQIHDDDSPLALETLGVIWSRLNG